MLTKFTVNSPPKVSTPAFFLAWYSDSSAKPFTDMSGDDDQPPPIMTSEVQGQFDGMSKEMKKMAASITTLVKAITPKDNATAQSGSDGIMDP